MLWFVKSKFCKYASKPNNQHSSKSVYCRYRHKGRPFSDNAQQQKLSFIIINRMLIVNFFATSGQIRKESHVYVYMCGSVEVCMFRRVNCFCFTLHCILQNKMIYLRADLKLFRKPPRLTPLRTRRDRHSDRMLIDPTSGLIPQIYFWWWYFHIHFSTQPLGQIVKQSRSSQTRNLNLKLYQSQIENQSVRLVGRPSSKEQANGRATSWLPIMRCDDDGRRCHCSSALWRVMNLFFKYYLGAIWAHILICTCYIVACVYLLNVRKIVKCM